MVSELGSKIRFTFCFLLSFYLFLFCYYSLFFVFVLCTKLKKKKKEVILKHQVKKKKERWYWSNRYYHSIFSKLLYSWIVTFLVSVLSRKKKKDLIFFLFPHWLVVSAIYFLAVGIGLNSASWISWSSLLVLGRTEKEKFWVEKGKRVWD